MRPAERLDGFYRELKKIHKEQFQDWRFGQLMSNFIQFMAVEKRTDIFFPEEDRMLEYIREFADEYGSKPKKITAKDIANILNGNQLCIYQFRQRLHMVEDIFILYNIIL